MKKKVEGKKNLIDFNSNISLNNNTGNLLTYVERRGTSKKRKKERKRTVNAMEF